jgi:FkbM family methyltransferase
MFLGRGYDFACDHNSPLIIDGGANVGVSVAWFKQQWPKARVLAFEADPGIGAVLKLNVASAGFTNVTVVEKALWTSEGELMFTPEGGDAGRLDGDGSTLVATTRLRDWLTEPIDLLKLDIEGAEADVIVDCVDRLELVKNIVFEYHSIVGRPQRLGETLAILEKAGYRIWVRDEFAPVNALVAVTPSAGMDMRLNIWAKRMRNQ